MILIDRLKGIRGDVGFWYKDLTTGETLSYHPDKKVVAASVIKLTIMTALFEKFESGELRRNDLYVLKEEDKVPSCGALNYMHNGLEVTLLDMCKLMIIISDNTATNILADIVGKDFINSTIQKYGLKNTVFRRKMFDSALSAQGIQNHITARDMGRLLELIYKRELVSAEASEEMLGILLDQELESKIPFYLDDPVAHKTGEDDGTTHDVGIVMAERPFIVCFVSNNVYVPDFLRLIQEGSKELYIHTEKGV